MQAFILLSDLFYEEKGFTGSEPRKGSVSQLHSWNIDELMIVVVFVPIIVVQKTHYS
jgi:hypothetical protein